LPRQAEQAGLASAFNVAAAAISCCEIFFFGRQRDMSDSLANDRASVKKADTVISWKFTAQWFTVAAMNSTVR
jgi:hypothetical protein